jgi:predicted nucleic acid-binding protein
MPLLAVVDCSVAMAWCFPDEKDAFADSVLGRLAGGSAAVPSLWWLECANVLRLAERRGRITPADAGRYMALLSALPVVTDEFTHIYAFGATAALARAHGLTAYDAAYLELAIRLGLPIASLDQQVLTAAAALGVAEFRP